MRPSLFARKPFKYQRLLDQAVDLDATSDTEVAVLEAPSVSAPAHQRVRTLNLQAVLAKRREAEAARDTSAVVQNEIAPRSGTVSLGSTIAKSTPNIERHQAMRALASARLMASTNASYRPKLLEALFQMIRLGRSSGDTVRVAAFKQEAQRVERQMV
jgi:hypothetical protein